MELHVFPGKAQGSYLGPSWPPTKTSTNFDQLWVPTLCRFVRVFPCARGHANLLCTAYPSKCLPPAVWHFSSLRCQEPWLEPVLDGLPQVIITHVEIPTARWHLKQLLVIRLVQLNELARGGRHGWARCPRGSDTVCSSREDSRISPPAAFKGATSFVILDFDQSGRNFTIPVVVSTSAIQLHREPGATKKLAAATAAAATTTTAAADSCEEMPHAMVLLIFRSSHLDTLTAHGSRHCPQRRENATVRQECPH